jgi:hypothetical protein
VNTTDPPLRASHSLRPAMGLLLNPSSIGAGGRALSS